MFGFNIEKSRFELGKLLFGHAAMNRFPEQLFLSKTPSQTNTIQADRLN